MQRLRQYWSLSPVETGLVLLVLFGLGYFFASGSWNQNARLDAIYSFVEPGPNQYTFRIDGFIYDPVNNLNTGDYARFGSHFYANKAPGTILLGVLVYWPLHWLETAVLRFDPDHPLLAIANAYGINFGVSVVFAAVATLLYWRLLAALHVPARRALWITLALAFGTALFPYSTTLWGVATTTALVIAGYLGLCRGSPQAAVAAGASLGFAVCTDYLASLFVLIALVHLVVWRRNLVGWFCLGGVPALVVLLGYHRYCFDDAFTTASSLSQRGFLDQGRWLGIFGWPSARALFQLTLGPLRGIFFQMPVLLLTLVGFYHWFKRAPRDRLLWLCVASFVVPLLVVASFNGWHGGASVSARYLIAALPWLLVSLKELPRSRRWSEVLAVLTVLSVVNMLAIAATNTVAPEDVSEPLYSWVYPEFLRGDWGARGQPTRLLALYPAWPEIAPLTCFNLGEVLGLGGYARLLPWLAGSFGLFRFVYRRATDAASSSSIPRQDDGAVGAD